MLIQYWMALYLFTCQFSKTQKVSILLQESLVPCKFIKFLALFQQIFVTWNFITPQRMKIRFMSNCTRRTGSQMFVVTQNFHYHTTLVLHVLNAMELMQQIKNGWNATYVINASMKSVFSFKTSFFDVFFISFKGFESFMKNSVVFCSFVTDWHFKVRLL